MPLEGNYLWGSRTVYIMVLICQLIGISNINSIPSNALTQGTTGYTITLIMLYVFMGIPILYMESVVGQFTARDCIEVWRIYPFCSHMGYILLVWQATILIYNHIVTSFLLHYFLISFENPIPFYTCGSWSTKYCNTLATNFTVNQNCIKYENLYSYCDTLYKTFPEYQYWRYYLVKDRGRNGFNVSWRVCVASGLTCFVLYISCFKRSKSLKWAAIIMAIYPMVSLMLLLTGSMRQKGVVAKYEESLDIDFNDFVNKFRLSHIVQQIIYNLNIGSGVMFTMASSSTFRAPCFSDIVIAVVICTVFTVILVFTIAMMTCPYAYELGINPGTILKTPMSLPFEKIPRFINHYRYKTFYLFVFFSCGVGLGVSTMTIYLYSLLEVLFKRNPKLASYPGLTTFCSVLVLFLITIPFLSFNGINIVALNFRRYGILLSTFFGLLECLVFIIRYGINKLSEDVHFMLGIKPKYCMKTTWVLSIILLAYAFINEFYYQITNPQGYIYVIYVLLPTLGTITALFVIRLCIAICRKRFRKHVSLDVTWGPNNDVLQRSRTMFSAQAMTKEYIYRQYHLQAGIMARQKRANKKLLFH